ncbi:hypothetical protein H0E87_008601 [Populus deltoides]|uniref:Transmembrane protein n=1 Tax=Populus deltoides TaxID=3696 RepID=A0A8T2Z195_POPDE|nr:hypothetical protein H0E87_008601 [Populus deltoides]
MVKEKKKGKKGPISELWIPILLIMLSFIVTTLLSRLLKRLKSQWSQKFLNASLKLELGTGNAKGKGNSDQLAKIRNACNKKKEENRSKEESMEMMQKQDEYLQSSIEMGSSSSSSLSNDGEFSLEHS